ncbi:MAG: hypothetical protein LBQ48_04200 [Oscillospiraceae bacterium]|jgi:hypothetical protein|nr:hypothetical protein [Oscillospiraceae bacterium]
MKKVTNKVLAWLCAFCVLAASAGLFSAAGAYGEAMAVSEVSALKGVSAGTNLRNTAYIGADGGDRVSDFTMTAVKPLALDVTGARLNAASAYYQDWANAFSTSTIKILSLNVGQSTSGFTGILLYVGLPETGNAGNELWFQAVDSGVPAWVALKAAAPVYLLGTDGNWSQIAPSYHGGAYTVGLPDGFKGYINIPFNSFSKAFDTLSRLQFAIQGMGGENGGVDFGPLFMTANDLRTKDRACIDGEADEDDNPVLRSLFTGATAPMVGPKLEYASIRITDIEDNQDLRVYTELPPAPDGDWFIGEYGTIFLPTQFLAQSGGAVTLESENKAVAKKTLTAEEAPPAGYFANLNGSSLSNYCGVRFAARSYVIYKDGLGIENDITVYSTNLISPAETAISGLLPVGTQNGMAVRSVYSIARNIAVTLLERQDGLEELVETTEIKKDTPVTNIINNGYAGTVPSADVLSFVVQNAENVRVLAEEE